MTDEIIINLKLDDYPKLFCNFQFVDLCSPFINCLLPLNLWLLSGTRLQLVQKLFNKVVLLRYSISVFIVVSS